MKRADISHKKIVTDILVDAFAPLKDNNSINFVVKQDAKRLERMKVIMEFLFEKALASGEIYLSNNEQACVLLHLPHKEKYNLNMSYQYMKLAFSCIGISRILKVLKRQHAIKRFYPKEQHIRPMILGVKTKFKGNGTAARLMLELNLLYKNNTLPVIVDAASETNVKLYKKFGFQVFDTLNSLGFPIYFLKK